MPREGQRCSCPEGLVLSDVDEKSCRSSPAFIAFNNESRIIFQPLLYPRDEMDVEHEKEAENDDDDDDDDISNNGEGDDDDDDDDDDDEEGSHDTANNFYNDDDYEDEDDDEVDIDGMLGEVPSSHNNNMELTKQKLEERRQPKKLLLDYQLSTGIMLSYDTQSKVVP